MSNYYTGSGNIRAAADDPQGLTQGRRAAALGTSVACFKHLFDFSKGAVMSNNLLSHRPVVAALLMLSAAAVTTGCSSNRPAAREQLGAGTTSVEAAIAATTAASDLSVPEMATARDKLAQAQAAARAGEWDKARRLAEEADLDAQVARAKIAAGKSQKAAAEIDASLATLREELNRPPASSAVKP